MALLRVESAADGSRFLMLKPAPPPHISVVLNSAQTLTTGTK
jgi:hypothetical protein